MDVRFACNGCGRCCEGHHVPLTLDESEQWAKEGGQLIVLVEGYIPDGPGFEPLQRDHLLGRSYAVSAGQSEARIMVTVAAFNPGRCRHLQEDNRCGQYETRPLVCRIYPAEINPHIAFNPPAKDCPDEVWATGAELIASDRLVDPKLVRLVELSRQLDREEIATKVALCDALGMTVAALKGDGFTVWLPDSTVWLDALASCAEHKTPGAWAFQGSTDTVVDTIAGAGLLVGDSTAAGGAFISLAR